MSTFSISLSMEEAIAKINDVISSSASENWLYNYTISTPNGKFTVLVYEKYFFIASIII